MEVTIGWGAARNPSDPVAVCALMGYAALTPLFLLLKSRAANPSYVEREGEARWLPPGAGSGMLGFTIQSPRFGYRRTHEKSPWRYPTQALTDLVHAERHPATILIFPPFIGPSGGNSVTQGMSGHGLIFPCGGIGLGMDIHPATGGYAARAMKGMKRRWALNSPIVFFMEYARAIYFGLGIYETQPCHNGTVNKLAKVVTLTAAA